MTVQRSYACSGGDAKQTVQDVCSFSPLYTSNAEGSTSKFALNVVITQDLTKAFSVHFSVFPTWFELNLRIEDCLSIQQFLQRHIWMKLIIKLHAVE